MLRRSLLALIALGLFAVPAAAQTSRVSPAPVVLDAANECATLDVAGMGRAVWDVGGTFSGTVTFYVSVGGTNKAIDVSTADAPGTAVNSTTAAGAWEGNVAGWRTMLACMTSYTSGSALVTLSASAAGGGGGGGGGSGGSGGESTIADGSTAGVADVIGEAAAGSEQGLVIRCASGCGGSGGTALDDDAAFTVGTTPFTPIGGTYKSTRDQVNDNDGGAFAMTIRRAIIAALETPDGDSVMNDTSNAVNVVFPSAQNVAQSGAPWQVQSNSADIATQTTAAAILTAVGLNAQEVTLGTRLAESTFTGRFAAGAAASDNMANPTTTGVLSYNMCFDGSTWDRCPPEVAHDAADSGNPLKIGGKALVTNPTAVAHGDRVDAAYNKLGKAITDPVAPRERRIRNRIALTDTTETTLIAAGAASVFRDLIHLSCTNEGASEVRVDIRDATSGTVRLSFDMAADGGGFVSNFTIAWPQTTAANNWTAQLSGSVNVYCMAMAVEDL